MKVTKEKTENSQAFLTIEVEPPEIEVGLDKSYKRMVRTTKIPGFRKGKAPRDIFERYVGREGLFNEAINDMVPDAYEKALKSEGIVSIAQPQIEVSSMEPFIFKAVVPLQPTVKLGDYHQIRVAEETVDVTEEQVAAAIEQLRHQYSVWEPVERAADFNDMAIFDIKSEIDSQPYVNRIGMQYQLLKEQNFPVAGFSEQVAGMKAGESKEFKLKFPENYPNAQLVGKKVSFNIKMNEVKQEVLPELNDDFAGQVSKEFKSLEEMRGKVKEGLIKQAEQKARVQHEQKIVDELVKIAELEYPPVLVDMEIERLVEERLQRLQIPPERVNDYLKAIERTREQVAEELKPAATKNVTEALVMSKVTAEEKIEATEAEIDAEVEKMVAGVPEKNREEMKQYFNEPRSRESIRRLLVGSNTVKKLVEIAKGENANAEKTEKEG